MEHPMKNEILPMRQALLKRLNDSELNGCATMPCPIRS